MPLTSPFAVSTAPSSLFVATKDYDPNMARLQRMFKFNVYLPPMNRMRSSDKKVKRVPSGDIHLGNVGIIEKRLIKSVSFLAGVHVFGERSSSDADLTLKNFSPKSCLKNKN
jgi:hypothetical protein